MGFCCKLLTLLLAAIFIHVSLSLEFMDEGFLANDEAEENSAEVPAIITGYTRDTIAHFSPRRPEAGFRQLWERVPLQKDVIKRR
ncbi:uncharacterized protein [Drosophila kikkawai]|uniref:Uncharacterized protein n=1 Tax=Drosophila kikkawai TaxID=30033 RepID=A0A6P4IJB1_DROKI|nr:uncharacterized protein LOC108074930 [Drosophila kikkawai]